jgi:hypothetical protein
VLDHSDGELRSAFVASDHAQQVLYLDVRRPAIGSSSRIRDGIEAKPMAISSRRRSDRVSVLH